MRADSQRGFTNAPHGRLDTERGNALVEFALVAPLMLLLLLAVVEGGISATAFISVQNAARSAAMRNSGGLESATDQTAACEVALSELRGLPGVPSSGDCTAAPVAVTSALCAAGGPCGAAAASADGQAAVMVSVRYSPPALFRMPIAVPATVQATSQMRIRSYE